jgi:vacuolar-type H+-ATPase subunit C/Vma6
MIPILYVLIIAASVVIGIFAKLIPSFILLAKFTYPNAKYNAIGNPFIKTEEIQKLLVRDLDDFKNMVNTNRDYELKGESVEVLHNELYIIFHRMIMMLTQDSPQSVKGFYDAYLYKLDLSLLKKSVNIFLRGDKPPGDWNETLTARIFLPENKELLTQMFTLEIADFPNLLREYQYPEDLISLLEDTTEPIDYDHVNIAFDRYMLSRFENLTLPKQCQAAVLRFVKTYKDILNIKTILRAKEWGLKRENIHKLLVGRGRELEDWKLTELVEMEDVPEVISHLEGTHYMPYLRDAIVEYEKEDSVSPLEHALDVCFLHLLSDLSVEHTTNLGVGIRFVVSKEYETQNLKVIVKGLLEKLSLDTIKKTVVTE